MIMTLIHPCTKRQIAQTRAFAAIDTPAYLSGYAKDSKNQFVDTGIEYLISNN
jgi:hypothetical protein